jgi:hypothetical protein
MKWMLIFSDVLLPESWMDWRLWLNYYILNFLSKQYTLTLTLSHIEGELEGGGLYRMVN